MNDEYLTVYNPSKLYILELTAGTLEVLGQSLHLYIATVPDTKLAVKALDELVQQTDVVYRAAKHHSVYTATLEAPEDAIYSKQILFNPVKKI